MIEENYYQMDLFNEPEKPEKFFIIDAIILALPQLPKIYPLYINPYKKSLCSIVKTYPEFKYTSQGTIAREQRKLRMRPGYTHIKVYDHHKGLYQQ